MASVVFEDHNYFSKGFVHGIRKSKTKAGEICITNWHENLEILLCINGQGSIILDDRRYVFNKDNIIVVNSNVIHSLKSITKLEYICLHLSIEFCRENGIDISSVHFLELIADDRELITTLEELLKENNGNSEIKPAKVKALVLKILIRLYENFRSDEPSAGNDSRSASRIKKTILYISHNLNKQITLDDVATHVGINKYQLAREFKAETGKSIFEFINSLRCRSAMAMLKKGVSVSETAENCGFQNLSYFSRTYKKYIGELPGKHKKT